MTRLVVKPTGATKQKRNRPAKNGANKKAKKIWVLAFYTGFQLRGLFLKLVDFPLFFLLELESFSSIHFASSLLGLKTIFKKIFWFSFYVSH